MILPFGKYRGRDIRDVPVEYLEFLLGESQKTTAACREELQRKPPTSTEGWPKASAEQRLIILTALRKAGSGGIMLQDLCDAAVASIEEVVTHCVELDEGEWNKRCVDLQFDGNSGVAWAILSEPRPDGAQ
jgi:hypothetical protein